MCVCCLHCPRLLAQGLVLNAGTSRGPSCSGAIAELREDEDEAYFSSYGHYSIHEEMLKVGLSPSNIYLRPYLLPVWVEGHRQVCANSSQTDAIVRPMQQI